VTSSRQEGDKPHASEVLTPAAVFVNSQRIDDLQRPVSLRAGANPVLVRYNHAGRGYEGRNPAYLLGGSEKDSPDGKVIHWGEPVAVLYSKDKSVRISYPDFIWDDGLYITETQKSTARVHRIPDELLKQLWD